MGTKRTGADALERPLAMATRPATRPGSEASTDDTPTAMGIVDAPGVAPVDGDIPLEWRVATSPSNREVPEEIARLIALLPPGTFVAGKYRVERQIGRGAMGVVMACTHVDLNRSVALKFLCGGRTNPDFIARFRREAQLNARLRNPHITQILDFGMHPDPANASHGIPFMVMELLEGADLRRVLHARGGGLPRDLAIKYALQICKGMAEAHGQDIVHRDLKPSNVFVTRGPDGTDLLKIMDFGISKSTDEEDGEITKTGVILGTPKYMAPEQLFGQEPLDARVDIWSIGAILYQMLAGRPPYAESTLPRMCAALGSGKRPLALHALVPGVSPALSDVVLRCLEREPAARWPSIPDFVQALVHALGEESVGAFGLQAEVQAITDVAHHAASAPRSLRPPASTTVTTLVSTGPANPAPAPPASRPWGWLLAGAGIAGVIGLGLAVVVVLSLRARAPGGDAPHAAANGAQTLPVSPRPPEPAQAAEGSGVPPRGPAETASASPAPPPAVDEAKAAASAAPERTRAPRGRPMPVAAPHVTPAHTASAATAPARPDPPPPAPTPRTDDDIPTTR